jgi:hypothetical protein
MSTVTFTRSEKIVIGCLASVTVLLHCLVNLSGAYGFFRDELYYIACSEHLAWGYVDQPPFSLYLLRISRFIFGDSLMAIRLLPALAHGGTIMLTGLLVKEMGGKLFAIFLACLAVLLSPIHLGMTGIYSMNSIDIFVWSLAIYCIVRIINTQKQVYWIVLGLVLGIGLLNKISVLFLGAGIFAGILLTNPRWLATRWPYVAGILAVLLFLPYILWNLNHDQAHLEFIHNASTQKYSGRNRLDFIIDQFLFLNPLSTPVWIAGLLALFFYDFVKPYRIIGWIYIAAFIILVVNPTSKGEYLAPAYACLFAAAGIFFEQKLTSPAMVWLRYIYPALLIVTAGILLPMVMPVLPVKQYIVYSKALGMEPTSSENKQLSELPQFYADMFGWEEKARDVARVYNSLTEDEKQKCAIYSDNYGRCGAIDFFGKPYGLPSSIGSHNNYWIWGPRNCTGEVMIILGGTLEDHRDDFESCEEVAISSCTYCMPYENNVKIFLCRNLKQSLQEAWKDVKHYE